MVHVAAAVTGPGVSNLKTGIVLKNQLLNLFWAMSSHAKIVDFLKDDRMQTVGESLGSRFRNSAPVFTKKKEVFTGHIRVFLPDVAESNVPLSLLGHQNRTGERPFPSVSFCMGIPCGEVNPDSKKNPECCFRNTISKDSMQTVHHHISHREWSGAAIDQSQQGGDPCPPLG